MQPGSSAQAVNGDLIGTLTTGGVEIPAAVLVEPSGHMHGSLDCYSAVFQLAPRNAVAALSKALVINTDTVLASIYHAAAAAKTARIRSIELFIAATAAAILQADLVYVTAVTAPAAGNPAITPRKINPASPVAEAACLALPTTGGSIQTPDIVFGQEINLGANAARTDLSMPAPAMLWPPQGVSIPVPGLVMRAGVAEGYAIVLRAATAVTIKAIARILFTEE